MSSIKYENLNRLLTDNLKELHGEWIKKNNNNYEEPLCKLLGMTCVRGRYWDAEWENMLIEIKKGKSIWLDLVRYSEVFLAINSDASKETINLFFVPDKGKDRIQEVIGVTTDLIIQRLDLNKEISQQLLRLNKTVPRSLNCQASLTLKDIREIANFKISE